MLKNKYGLDLDEYNTLLEEQDGVCAICGDECPIHEHLSVDHDHETGEVRGLLCAHCNRMLGSARDDITVLARGIEYLNRGGDPDGRLGDD